MTLSADMSRLDRLLLERLLHRDDAAWRALVTRYDPLLLSIARRTFLRYGHPPAKGDVDDVVAEVWAGLLADDLRRVRIAIEQGHLLPTLHVMTRHRAIDALRRMKAGRSASELEAVPAADEPAPDTRPLEAEERDRLRDALAALPDVQRLIVTLVYLHGKTHREAAELAGIAPNSVGPTLHRALGRLRSTLDDHPAPRHDAARARQPEPRPAASHHDGSSRAPVWGMPHPEP